MKLVVHIGHGKTGSSSIQQSLLEAAPQLAAQGILYLGLVLEHARNETRPAWQVTSGSNQLFDRLDAGEANRLILGILEEELARLQDEGVHLAIWSNEWLFSRYRTVMPALQELKRRGQEIEIQCYIRRHDKWAQSAYAQWGLKHKSYSGPIRSFSDWLPVFGDKDFRFSPALGVWDAAFGSSLRVFNFDAAGDVVQHFLTVNRIHDVVPIQENKSPPPTVTAAQTVYNSRFKEPIFPHAFDPILKLLQARDENGASLPVLDQLVPSRADLEELVADRADDIRHINALLARSGEPELSFEDPPRVVEQPSAWEMEQLMLKMIYALFEEMQSMRRQIATLQRKLNE